MRIDLCYKKEDTPIGKIICKNFTTIKDAMIVWDTQISKIATYGALKYFDGLHYKTKKF